MKKITCLKLLLATFLAVISFNDTKGSCYETTLETIDEQTYLVKTIDFSQWSSSNSTLTGGTNYCKIGNLQAVSLTAPAELVDYIALQGIGNGSPNRGWWLRVGSGYNYLYAFYAGRSGALKNLPARAIVEMTCSGVTWATTTGGAGAATYTENTFENGLSVTITKAGDIGFNAAKDGKINKIVIKTIFNGLNKPTAEVTKVNGTERTVNFSSELPEATFLKSDAKDGIYESFDGTITTSTSQTVYVKAQFQGLTSDALAYDIVAGTTIQLNTPYRTMKSHTDGVSTISLSCDQSGILCNPTATIAYTINDGAETEIASGTTITVNDGEKLTYYAKATGYDKSINVVETATALYSGNTIWKETYASTGDKDISRGSIAFDSWYYNIIADNKKISERLLATDQSVQNWLYRTTGIYCGKPKKYALLNMKAGQNITFTGKSGTNKFYIGTVTNLEKDEWNSVPGEKYIFNVVADGNVEFQVDRYASLNGIEVKDASLPSTVSLTVSSAGLATYTPSYNLDFSSASKITAYKAAVSGTAITLTKVTTVAAGEGVLLRGKAGEETTEAIAVATSATTANAGNEFVPVTGEIDQLAETDGDYTNFVLNKVDGVVGFYKANNTHVAAGKAYLKVLTSTLGTEPGKSMKLVFDDETTGITEVSNAAKASDKAYYTLSGQRVNAPVKGLYLHNGKKVIVK